jgi:hypothetical protein
MHVWFSVWQSGHAGHLALTPRRFSAQGSFSIEISSPTASEKKLRAEEGLDSRAAALLAAQPYEEPAYFVQRIVGRPDPLFWIYWSVYITKEIH